MAKEISSMTDRITINPAIRFGKPCIRGTRIAVVDVLNLLTAGYTIEQIPEQYPEVRKEDVIAAIEFAANLTEEPTRVFTPNLAPHANLR